MLTLPEARKYHQLKNRLFVINLIFTIAILLASVLSGFSLWLKTALSAVSQNMIARNGLYISALLIAFWILGFPLEFYERFLLERRFKLSNQNLGGYLKDNLKKSLISLLIGVTAVEFLYIFLDKFSENWWIFSAGGWLILSVFLAKITPNILLPIFYKYIPLKDIELRNKILEMFSSAKARLKDVYIIDFSSRTKKLNAAVVGFGNSRRIVLADNLLKELSHDEILSIAAHELGHYKNKDTIKIIAFSAIVTGVLFYLSDIILKRSVSFFGFGSIADIASFPLFALVMLLLGLLVLPCQNGFVRRLETKADCYSLCLTEKPGAFISMMEKLAQKNLADMQPSRFIEIMLYDHPAIAKRIALAREFKGKSG
jgi:STE24 endopeptidase